jgi:ADP-heptose:LPS heptosyltransferase
MSVLDQLGTGARLGIVRLRSLGDCVLTTPAITLLKRHRPDLRLAVVVEPPFRAVFEDNPQIDEILGMEGGQLRRFRPDVCVNFHGGTRSLVLTATSGARMRAGFGHYRYPWAYNVRIPRAQEILRVDRKVHTAEHLASAMFYLGVPECEIPRASLYCGGSWPPPDAEPYAVIHARASADDKTWPAERFAELAAVLASDWNLEPVFIGAPADDLTPFASWRRVQGPLRETKRLLAGASFFVGNDSGPAHMAAAFGLPSVVLFAASDPVVWAPWRTVAEVVTASEGGMASLPLRKVLDAVERVRVMAC